MLDDPGVDMALVINVTPLLSNPIDVIEAAAAVARGRAKPVLAVMMATEEFYEAVKAARDLPPVYRFPESAARALSMLARYARLAAAAGRGAGARLRGRRQGAWPRSSTGLPDGATSIRPTPSAVLDLYGIPLAPWQRGGGRADEALGRGREIGYPGGAQGDRAGPRPQERRGRGAVDLRDEEELAAALWRRWSLAGRRRRPPRGGLPRAGDGARRARGDLRHHRPIPRFGPLLMFGLGGKYVEVFQDVRFAVPPLAAARGAGR